MNIYNCSTSTGTGIRARHPPAGAWLSPVQRVPPAVPGAKHKLSRDYKLAKLAERVRVPSALAAGTMHMARRFLLEKAANPLETAAFATFGRIA